MLKWVYICLFVSYSNLSLSQKNINLSNTTWKLKNGNDLLIFKGDSLIEVLNKEIEYYVYSIEDSVFMDGMIIKGSDSEKILVLKQNHMVVFCYYIIGYSKSELDLLTGNNLRPLIYYRNKKNNRPLKKYHKY